MLSKILPCYLNFFANSAVFSSLKPNSSSTHRQPRTSQGSQPAVLLRSGTRIFPNPFVADTEPIRAKKGWKRRRHKMKYEWAGNIWLKNMKYIYWAVCWCSRSLYEYEFFARFRFQLAPSSQCHTLKEARRSSLCNKNTNYEIEIMLDFAFYVGEFTSWFGLRNNFAMASKARSGLSQCGINFCLPRSRPRRIKNTYGYVWNLFLPSLLSVLDHLPLHVFK